MNLYRIDDEELERLVNLLTLSERRVFQSVSFNGEEFIDLQDTLCHSSVPIQETKKILKYLKKLNLVELVNCVEEDSNLVSGSMYRQTRKGNLLYKRLPWE